MSPIRIPVAVALLAGLSVQAPTQAQRSASAEVPPARLHFEPIQDSAAPAYVARNASVAVVVDREGLTLRLPDGRSIRCTLVGGTGGAVVASEPTGGVSSYFLSADPAEWRQGVPHYGRVAVRGGLPGVDLVCYAAGAHVEFDLELGADVDPSSVRLRLDGVEGMCVDEQGAITMPVGVDTLSMRAPVAFQRDVATGERREVESSYRLESILGASGVEIGFALGAHDSARPIVIDPIIEFSTLLGGYYDDNVQDVAYDPVYGDTVLVGCTNSSDFPFVNELPQAFTGSHAFVSRFDSSGALVLSTFLGNGASNAVVDIDAFGNAIVAGSTIGLHPVTIGALQPTPVGGYDWFVTRLGRNGQLQWSTYAGGAGNDGVVDVKVGLSGYIYIAGSSTGGFPTTPGAYNNSGSGPIVAAIDSGIQYYFATSLGFTGSITGLAIDNYFGVWVTGTTNANDMPTSANPFQATNPGLTSGFVFGLTSDGANLVVSTYFGGSGYDQPADLFVRFNQNMAELYVTIVGITDSPDLPTQNPLQPAFGGSFNDGFITQFTHLLGGLRFSTYLGGSSQDILTRIDEDDEHRILVAGWTQSQTLPMDDAFQGPSYQGPCGYLMRLMPDGFTIDYATYFGGRFAGANMDVTGLAVQPGGEAIVTGTTRNAVWYTTPNAIQSTFAGASGSTDSFLLRFSSTTVQSYGQGTGVGFYNIAPVLSAAGDLTPGSTVKLRIQDSTGGQDGVLVFGLGGPTSTPLWGGTLLVQPALLLPFVVGGGAQEQWGYWEQDVVLPGGASLNGIVMQAQAVIGTPALATFTQGLEFVLQ